ncbi:hypothetical protein BI364_01320 [Acidihalobacter yilgarnensis]|uniref:DUF4426 domain-containing protein n=1 Tax=Acidihalobacter yilgarnensis TaxID=2819280 RepID=A0A1D8IK49_9GAMM|nr:DUF4426 domain-containing protein [Acidihalobacter yilgarnensis]AOU96825.1 hypothetical protein BI364_01320 [Acidihalobacter yilgarnensis]
MKTLSPAARAFAALFAIALTGSADADQVVLAGEYIIHFSTLNSDFLGAAIAMHAGIARAPDRGLLELSVRKSNQEVGGNALPATVSVSVATADGHYQAVEIHRVDTADGTRYLGGFPIADGELLEFHVHVDLPNGSMQYFRHRQRFHMESDTFNRETEAAIAAG